MAYATDLQHIIHHLKTGGKLKPHGVAAGKPTGPAPPHPSPFAKPPEKGAKAVGGMPLGRPPKQGK